MGGEKNIVRKASFDPQGSPPHGRGKEHRPKSQFRPTGITPAWAGKRVRAHVPANRNEDHPRVGGEKTKKIP